MIITKDRIIASFVSLGQKLDMTDRSMQDVAERAFEQNNWFTPENVSYCLNNWQNQLTKQKVTAWLNETPVAQQPKTIGVIMAGNIPLVGLHDLLCVLASGNIAWVKLSQKDEVLMKYCIHALITFEPAFSERIIIQERIIKPDAVIATGSNNTARYFEYYYKDIPRIIRKNRTSVAVLDGSETKQELEALCDDIFLYFGLGCRSVTKLLVPQGYDMIPLLDASEKYKDYENHNKYANNNTYHRAILLMNLTPHLDTGYLLAVEDEKLHSPLSCIFYQQFENEESINSYLEDHKEEIQVVVSHSTYANSIPFGTSQITGLSDYADGVDTLAFLCGL